MKAARIIRLLAVAASALLLAAMPALAQVKVGSKNFTEQFIVAELYAQALEAAGIKVERKINLGGTLIAHKALEEKQIDLYPEYTGTMLLAVLKAEPMTDRKAVYDKVKAEYAAKGLVVLNETPMNNSYDMVVRPGDRRAVQARDAVRSREGLEGAEARRRPRVPRPQGRASRPQGEVRDGVQGRPAARDRAALPGAGEQADRRRQRLLDRRHDRRDEAEAPEGRQGLWPPYFIVPVVRKDALDANPKIADVLNQVSALLDRERTMAEMNYKVDGEKMEPKDVARDFLKSKGVVK